MKELGSDHLVLPIVLTGPTASMYSYALVDNEGSAISFIDTGFAALYRLPTKRLENPLTLNMVDGCVVVSGSLTHYVEISMRISHYTEQCIFLLIKLGHYPVVLGIKWLQIHDVGTK